MKLDQVLLHFPQNHLEPRDDKNTFFQERLSPVVMGFTLLASLPVVCLVAIKNVSRRRGTTGERSIQNVAYHSLVSKKKTRQLTQLEGILNILQYRSYSYVEIMSEGDLVEIMVKLDQVNSLWETATKPNKESFFITADLMMDLRSQDIRMKILNTLFSIYKKDPAQKEVIFPIIKQASREEKYQEVQTLASSIIQEIELELQTGV